MRLLQLLLLLVAAVALVSAEADMRKPDVVGALRELNSEIVLGWISTNCKDVAEPTSGFVHINSDGLTQFVCQQQEWVRSTMNVKESRPPQADRNMLSLSCFTVLWRWQKEGTDIANPKESFSWYQTIRQNLDTNLKLCGASSYPREWCCFFSKLRHEIIDAMQLLCSEHIPGCRNEPKFDELDDARSLSLVSVMTLCRRIDRVA